MRSFSPVIPPASHEPPIVDPEGQWLPDIELDEEPDVKMPVAKCGMPKRKGAGPCQFVAGKNTDHLGWGACWLHSGRTRNLRKHAARKAAEHFAHELDVGPEEALLMEVRRTAGRVAWVDAMVRNLPPEALFDEGPDGISMRRLEGYGLEQRKHLARTAKMTVDAGVAQRQVALAERTGEAIWLVLSHTAAVLQLTPEQEALMPAAFRDALLELDAADAEGAGMIDAEGWEDVAPETSQFGRAEQLA